jgi:predicted nucleic acid-binding Zn ribbon protein
VTTPRTCVRCRRPVVSRPPQSRYCSVKCRRMVQYKLRRLRGIAARREPSAKAAIGTYYRVCRWCGREFTSTRKDSRLCSDACRQQGRRHRLAFRKWLRRRPDLAARLSAHPAYLKRLLMNPPRRDPVSVPGTDQLIVPFLCRWDWAYPLYRDWS